MFSNPYLQLLRFIPTVAIILAASDPGVIIADEFIEEQLNSIAQEMTAVYPAYGMTITDTLYAQDHPGEPIDRRSYTFFVSRNNYYYRVIRYPSDKLFGSPEVTHILVANAHGNETVSAMISQNRRIMTKKAHPRGPLSIGDGADMYWFTLPGADSNAQPQLLPIQMVRNPCVAPLPISPGDLKDSAATLLSQDPQSRIYQFIVPGNDKHIGNGYRYVVRLHFSSKHNDNIITSEIGEIGAGEVVPTGALPYAEIRAVERWQSLRGGSVVPSRFAQYRVRDGKKVVTAVREISDVQLEDVPGAQFDITQLPAFKDRWDVINEQPITLTDVLAGHKDGSYPAKLPKQTSMVWVVVANAFVIALIVFAAIFTKRRHDRGSGNNT